MKLKAPEVNAPEAVNPEPPRVAKNPIVPLLGTCANPITAVPPLSIIEEYVVFVVVGLRAAGIPVTELLPAETVDPTVRGRERAGFRHIP